MYTLYHHPLCPFSRNVRILLAEKKQEFDLVEENYWEKRDGFLALNPASETPVLILEDGNVLAGCVAIMEYLEEIHPLPVLIGDSALERAEVRRLMGWFHRKFHREVCETLLFQKIIKRLKEDRSPPDSKMLRSGYENIRFHAYYINWLAERRNWLAGSSFSLADIVAAAHLSCIDYLGDIPWEEVPAAMDWYSKVKSRPSIRPILMDYLPGIPPTQHYADLDF